MIGGISSKSASKISKGLSSVPVPGFSISRIASFVVNTLINGLFGFASTPILSLMIF